MKNKTRIGIVGYGNLGRGVEACLGQTSDLELVAIFTRRDPLSLNTKSKVETIDKIEDYKDLIDVMILCGGSANDLDSQAPEIGRNFNIVDAFDNHDRIPEYYDLLNKVSKKSNKISLIATGWDPGLFSLNRVLLESVLPEGHTYTFWGQGLSQGHSDAIRRLDGVRYGVQYTIPSQEAIERVRQGTNPDIATRDRHDRICYVVPEEGADIDLIEDSIVNMPNYFKPYKTKVHFITKDIYEKEHQGMPHGGFVIRTGNSANANKQRIEFSLNLESNPEFTASVLVAYARAVAKIYREGRTGALTVFDIPISYLSEKSGEELRRDYL